MEQSNFFGTESNLEGLPLTSKAASGYFGQIVWDWSKRLSLDLEKSALTRTIKVSPNVPAGAANFPPVTCGNRRQSLPAEIFARIRGSFCLRNMMRGAVASIFARASFTV